MNLLYQKTPLETYKNMNLIYIFPKGFLSKIWNFFILSFWAKWAKKKSLWTFYIEKMHFQTIKKMPFKKVTKLAFFSKWHVHGCYLARKNCWLPPEKQAFLTLGCVLSLVLGLLQAIFGWCKWKCTYSKLQLLTAALIWLSVSVQKSQSQSLNCLTGFAWSDEKSGGRMLSLPVARNRRWELQQHWRSL